MPTFYLFLATFLSYLPSYFIPFLNTDEGGWATMGTYAFSHELYLKAVDHKPPFLFQFHWLLSGGEYSMLLLHMSTALFAFLGALMFFQVLRFFFDRERAFFGALMYALLSGLVNYSAYAPERIYLTFIVAAALLALKTQNAKSLNKKLMLALGVGLLIGAAGGTKQPAFLLGLVVFWLLIGRTEKNKISLILTALIGLFVFTFISWGLVGVPFSGIWQEAYLSTFQYIQGQRQDGLQNLQNLLPNFLAVLFIAYLPISIGALLFFSRIKKYISRSDYQKYFFQIVSLSLLLATSVLSISLGGRFYQNYFIVLLPLLSILTCIVTEQNFRLRKQLIFMAITLAVGYSTWTLTRQFLDKNKNWDSQIEALVDEVKKDTGPSDPIWINHAVPSVYYMTARRSPSRFIYFTQVIKYVDVCRSHKQDLNEDLADANYQELIQNLVMSPPKIIFWVERHVNSCADRLRLDNFPSIKALIEKNYEQKWSNRLGRYYLRKPSHNPQ